MRVLILGGDGYLGWPTAMYLSSRGHDVTVMDNYFRRRVCLELDIPFLVDAPNLHERAALWRALGGSRIEVRIGDVTNYEELSDTFRVTEPEVVIHYAEQPSAPYSMMGQREAIFTLQNNLIGTANLVHAVHSLNPDCHIVKLGTMGEYGTPNIDIEEGWIDIDHNGRSDRFLFPRQAGSLYHTTKVQDTDLLWFYVRTWGLRVTDLMQGPVYGIFTEEMRFDDNLVTHFNYDEIFGTVLNRFIVQAVAGIPLTVYGTGEQIRGYLNLIDTLECLRLAVENPATRGELRVCNQFTETFSVNELARKVVDAAASIGINVSIENHINPRIEAEEHYYNPVRRKLLDLGLEPHPLTEEVLTGMLSFVRKHEECIRSEVILPRTKWQQTAAKG